MSELQPGLLEENIDGVKTLAGAFGCRLRDLHMTDEDGKEFSPSKKHDIIMDILTRKESSFHNCER